jgi:hypothetical protein
MTSALTRTAVVVAGALLGGAAALPAQTLGVKTGQWSWTVTMTGVPQPPPSVPPDVAAKIREEAQKPHTVLACISAEDLRNLNLGRVDEDDDCKVTSRKITATTADFVRTCAGDEPRTETVRIEATSPESMRVTAIRTAGTGPSGITMTGKWVGATCKED